MPISPSVETGSARMLSMHRALQISEVQDLIFSFNSQGDAARCVTVCKTWKEVALNHIWHSLTDVWPLFNLLAPLKWLRTKEGKRLAFTRRIRPSDWVRFFTFAGRVKQFITLLSTVFPHESAFTEVLRSRTELRILPNLKKLQLLTGNTDSLRYATLFLHKNLDSFTVAGSGTPDNISEIETLLEEMAFRAPKLRTVKLWILVYNGVSISSALARSITSQISLEVLSLAPGLLTTPVLDSLSQLRKLRRVIVDHLGMVDLSSIKTISCGSADTENSFPSLLSLDLQTRLASVIPLISSHSNFARLQQLHIDMAFYNDAVDLQRCLEVVSTTCKKLRRLELEHYFDGRITAAVIERERNLITKDTLAPLTSFTCLSSFSLTHTQPILMCDDDLIDLMAHCPPLEELHLNPSPIQSVPPSMHLPSLGVMHRVAKCQPGLKRLSLCLEALSGDELDLPCGFGIVANPFNDLTELSVGKSTVGDVDRVALYLSQILPSGCELKYRSDIYGSAIDWAGVARKLPLLTKFCSRQRQQIRELGGYRDFS